MLVNACNRPLPLVIPGLDKGGHSGRHTAPSPGPGRPCLAPAVSQRLLSACWVTDVHLDWEGVVSQSERPRPHGASDLGEQRTVPVPGPWEAPGEGGQRRGPQGTAAFAKPEKTSRASGDRGSPTHSPSSGWAWSRRSGLRPARGPGRAGACQPVPALPARARARGRKEPEASTGQGLPAGALPGREHPRLPHGGRPSPDTTRPDPVSHEDAIPQLSLSPLRCCLLGVPRWNENHLKS